MKKTSRILLFLAIFVLGCYLRLLNVGWFMYILLVPEAIFRLFYLIAGLTVAARGTSKFLFYALQISYLLASFCVYDGGDVYTYAFAGLWKNPPNWTIDLVILCYPIFIVLTVVLLIIAFVKGKKKSSNTSQD